MSGHRKCSVSGAMMSLSLAQRWTQLYNALNRRVVESVGFSVIDTSGHNMIDVMMFQIGFSLSKLSVSQTNAGS